MLTVKQIENAQPGSAAFRLFIGGGLGYLSSDVSSGRQVPAALLFT
ncbi:MAG: hypothetical protein LBQ79_00870 [Deltaproteobacteria bacterium]|nr:hypothetical protein [Deltaproteobacteria bacterium]